MGTPSGLLITNANVDLREIGIIKKGGFTIMMMLL